MGNCLFGGMGGGEENEVVKVVRSDGGIMEFRGPIVVECITDEFPGHGIFRSHDLFWKPLAHHEVLLAGESYYLLPLNCKGLGGGGEIVQVGHVRSSSYNVPPQSLVTPYRMSCDGRSVLKRSYTEVFSRPYKHNNGGRVWKVKLVISPGQLLEILSQETRTQELIESVRTVAKCRNIGVSSLGFSDQWSLSSSSLNASSKQDGLLEI
ncbi:unnamed protein product [Camellia sinensis]